MEFIIGIGAFAAALALTAFIERALD